MSKTSFPLLRASVYLIGFASTTHWNTAVASSLTIISEVMFTILNRIWSCFIVNRHKKKPHNLRSIVLNCQTNFFAFLSQIIYGFQQIETSVLSFCLPNVYCWVFDVEMTRKTISLLQNIKNKLLKRQTNYKSVISRSSLKF